MSWHLERQHWLRRMHWALTGDWVLPRLWPVRLWEGEWRRLLRRMEEERKKKRVTERGGPGQGRR